MNSHLSRLAGACTALALSAAFVMIATPANAVSNSYAVSAAEWLAEQPDADTHLFNTSYEYEGEISSYTDYGLNLDLQFALDALGETDAADATYNAVIENGDSYTDSYGTRYAGAVGKLATMIQLHGDDPSDTIPDRDLILELEDLVVTEGEEAGRAKDFPDTDYQSANTIGQSWDVRALVGADSELAGPAAEFLADQQCEGGGLRLYQNGAACTPAVDATAFAIIALDIAGGFDAEVQAAADWLVSQQSADGSLADVAGANSNSTALAAVALETAGETAAAAKAAQWLVGLQVTDSTPGLADEAGAIAFDPAALADGQREGISTTGRDQWVRTTVQAAMGVRLATEPEPAPEPGPVASMSLSISIDNPKQGDTITVTARGEDADGASNGDVSDEITLKSSVGSDTIRGNTVTFNHASPHLITATHSPTGTTASVLVEVTPLAAAGSDQNTSAPVSTDSDALLPDAGAAGEPWQLLAAVAMVMAGSGLLVARRRVLVSRSTSSR